MSRTTQRTAVRDDALQAIVISRLPLHYAAGADATEDRPAHVRAASSIAWLNERIVLIQDDANFVVLLGPNDGSVQSHPLPAGKEGLRQFDDTRGNKKYKLDLEACAVVPHGSGPVLYAFGSGSKRRRRNVVAIDAWDRTSPRVRLHDATTLYERLERETDFAGSDMNIEGVVAVAESIRFFGRGNGKARRGLKPCNATCDVGLSDLQQYLQNPAHAAPPEPRHVVQYVLGELDGIPLGFTDAATMGDAILYAAAAEGSDDATEDGVVSGSVLGAIDVRGVVRYTPLVDANGRRFVEKVEGVVLSRSGAARAYVVIDPDDATRPAELCEVELRGTWQA